MGTGMFDNDLLKMILVGPREDIDRAMRGWFREWLPENFEAPQPPVAGEYIRMEVRAKPMMIAGLAHHLGTCWPNVYVACLMRDWREDGESGTETIDDPACSYIRCD